MDATSWTNPRGFGRFTRNIVSRLVALHKEHEYLLFVEDGAIPDDLPAGSRRAAVRQSRPSGLLQGGSSRKMADLARLSLAATRAELDVFLFPSLISYFPVFGMPTIVGIHDAMQWQFPEVVMGKFSNRCQWWLKQKIAIARAAKIFTVSQSAQADLGQYLRMSPELIGLVSEAPDPIFYPRGAELVNLTLASLGMDPGDEFILAAGGISPHKNLETLIEAYASVAKGAGTAIPALMIVGDMAGPYVSSANELRALVEKRGLGGKVRFPGFVSDEALAGLYSGARVVVLPSLAEGFGLPAVEAAACGAPLLVSDIPAHRENLLDSALYFPARDVSTLAAELGALLTSPTRASAFSEQAVKAASRFSWDVAADQLQGLLDEVVERHAGHRSPKG